MTDTASEREALRARHQVRPLTSEEEGTSIEFLPDGVYGFTHSPAAPESPLFQQKTFQSFETRKLPNGDVHLIGFATPREAELIDARHEPVELNLYPDPWEQATKAVAISFSRMTQVRKPSREDGNFIRMQVHPVD